MNPPELMKRFQTISRAAAVLIVMLLSGCDNVQWGGVDLAFVPPPPKGNADAGEVDTDIENATRMPAGPVLYHVHLTRSGTPVLLPIAEVSGDSLRSLDSEDWELFGARFIGQFLRDGSEFTLFRQGQRVGTFVVRDAALPEPGVCPRLPRAVGTLELAQRGDSIRPTEYLAMAKADAPDENPRIRGGLPVSRGMQVIAPILAERLLRSRGAQLPGNWRAAMAQLVPFPLPDTPEPGFATTFLVGDQMGTGPYESTVAYSVFFVGVPKAQVGYDTAHVSFRDFPTQGKAIPRIVDYLDWDRDEQVELLLEIYGTNSSNFAAVAKVGDKWQRIFVDRCEVQAPKQPTDTIAGSAPEEQSSAAPAGRPAPSGPPLLGRPAGSRQ